MSDKIIKSAATPARKVVKQEVYDSTVEARQIVEMAQSEAAAIIEEAREEASQTRATAREEGYQEGLSEWNAAVVDAVKARQHYLDECEPEVVRLSTGIAEKILGQRLNAEPEAMVSIVREALRGIREERNLTIKVNPEDLDVVTGHVHELEESVPGECRIRVVPGAAVTPGGCIVESELGTIDARIETQLKCLEQMLVRAARKGQ